MFTRCAQPRGPADHWNKRAKGVFTISSSDGDDKAEMDSQAKGTPKAGTVNRHFSPLHKK